MINTLKVTIKKLAKHAVILAEKEYGSGQGKIKKQKAINYVIKNLPFSALVNRIIGIVLSDIIDELVEASVDWLHEIGQIQGE